MKCTMRNPFTWPAPTGRRCAYRMIGGSYDGRVLFWGGFHVDDPLTGGHYQFEWITPTSEIVLVHRPHPWQIIGVAS